MLVYNHKGDLTIHATTIFTLVPFGIIGSTYQKSPHNITTFPPKGASQPIMCLSVRSTISKTYMSTIGASSQTIVVACVISFARSYCLLIAHTDDESGFRNILKCSLTTV
ncbi:unnamed protein product [Lupinus luteus]|uniref:Uncharacterized protein n=1 Tax=Lupinus luteus TaxID=3873 RepID=A0AAV1VXH9_LUPLU